MADFQISLKTQRRFRRDLILFLEALSLFLHAGYDLSFAWGEALRVLERAVDPDLRLFLTFEPSEEGMGGRLKWLAESYPSRAHRLWFEVLRELYSGGAGLSEAVGAVADTLRREQVRDLEAHCRSLPTRINVLMTIFFLPPILALLLGPLLFPFLNGGW